MNFIKGGSSSKSTKASKAAKEEEEKVENPITTIKAFKEELFAAEEMAENAEQVVSTAEAVAEDESAAVPVDTTKENNAKKLFFGAAIVGIAAKMIADKAGKSKKKAVPQAPLFTTRCYGGGLSQKTGMPLVCVRIPKKIGIQFKNKELKLDLPSLYLKKAEKAAAKVVKK